MDKSDKNKHKKTNLKLHHGCACCCSIASKTENTNKFCEKKKLFVHGKV